MSRLPQTSEYYRSILSNHGTRSLLVSTFSAYLSSRLVSIFIFAIPFFRMMWPKSTFGKIERANYDFSAQRTNTSRLQQLDKYCFSIYDIRKLVSHILSCPFFISISRKVKFQLICSLNSSVNENKLVFLC